MLAKNEPHALDRTAPAVVMQKMTSKMPQAQFVELQGVGHFGWAENAGQFNTRIIDFLSTNGFGATTA